MAILELVDGTYQVGGDRRTGRAPARSSANIVGSSSTDIITPKLLSHLSERSKSVSEKYSISELRNQILQGDCIEILRKIPDDSIDLILADPPYLMNYRTNRRKDNKHRFCTPIVNDDNPEFIAVLIGQCYRVLKPNHALYMFCNDTHVDFFKRELEKLFRIRNLIVWIKNNHTAGDLNAAFGKRYEFIFLVNKGRSLFRGRRLTDVWGVDNEERIVLNNDDRPKLHQNQKPVPLLKRCILKHSDVGDLVLDPVCGSGSSLIAAAELGRDYLGIEIEHEFVQLAKRNLECVKMELPLEEINI